MKSDIVKSSEYNAWLMELKSKLKQSQIKASVKVNTILLEFYWELGNEIIQKQKNSTWGSGFLKQLSDDLMAAFPTMKGFSQANLQYIRRWVLFYSKSETSDCVIVAQVVPQLVIIPWESI